MSEWIPLLQSLVWPLFFAILIFFFRSWFLDLLEIIKNRVASGSDLSVGPGGFSLGAAPRLEDTDAEDVKLPEEIIEEAQKRPAIEEPDMDISNYFRLIHSAKHNPKISRKSGRAYYALQVSLDADNPALLDRVSKVIYHLHPTFPNPDLEIKTRENNFGFTTSAWGQFNLSADVYFIDSEEKPIKLFRYLNF